MSHYGKCKHDIYLDGCRKCFPLPGLTKVGEELIQELVECFNEDKEMTANELADELTKMFRGEEYDRLIHEIPDMLRQQAQEIEDLKNANRFIQNFAEEQHQRALALEMRELTDGEIDEVAQENFEGVGRLIYMIQSDVSVKDFKEAIRSFAKAILKKAS